jgi:hypothetical protein
MSRLLIWAIPTGLILWLLSNVEHLLHTVTRALP